MVISAFSFFFPLSVGILSVEEAIMYKIQFENETSGDFCKTYLSCYHLACTVLKTPILLVGRVALQCEKWVRAL